MNKNESYEIIYEDLKRWFHVLVQQKLLLEASVWECFHVLTVKTNFISADNKVSAHFTALNGFTAFVNNIRVDVLSQRAFSSSGDKSISHKAPLTCGQTRFTLPFNFRWTSIILYLELVYKCGNRAVMTAMYFREQTLNLQYIGSRKEKCQILLAYSQKKNIAPWRKPRQKVCCWCYCSVDHKVQYVTVKNGAPWMHLTCEVLFEGERVCIYVLVRNSCI